MKLRHAEIDGKPSYWAVAVYKIYSDDGRLLYVGASGNPNTRLKTHSYSSMKKWGEVGGYAEAEWFGSKDEAMQKEAEIIVSQRPAFNKKIPHKMAARMVTGARLEQLTGQALPRRLFTFKGVS